MKFQGTFQQLQENEDYLQHLSPPESEKQRMESKEITKVLKAPLPQLKLMKSEEKDPKETEELIARGRISKTLYFKYFKAGASTFVLSILILFFILTQIAVSSFDYWLAFWYDKN